MLNNQLVRDVFKAIMIIGILIAAYYLLITGFFLTMVFAYSIPGWLLFAVVLVILFKRKQKLKNKKAQRKRQ